MMLLCNLTSKEVFDLGWVDIDIIGYAKSGGNVIGEPNVVLDA
jgi:hypothetical protein